MLFVLCLLWVVSYHPPLLDWSTYLLLEFTQKAKQKIPVRLSMARTQGTRVLGSFFMYCTIILFVLLQSFCANAQETLSVDFTTPTGKSATQRMFGTVDTTLNSIINTETTTMMQYMAGYVLCNILCVIYLFTQHNIKTLHIHSVLCFSPSFVCF